MCVPCLQHVAGEDEGDAYADVDPEQSEENLQLDADEDMDDGDEAQDYATYDDVHGHGTDDEGHTAGTADADAAADATDYGGANQQHGAGDAGRDGYINGNREAQAPGYNGTASQSYDSAGSQGNHHTVAGYSRPGRSRHGDAGYGTHAHDHAKDSRRQYDSRETGGRRHEQATGGYGGRGDRVHTHVSAAAAARRQAQMLHKRRAEAVELYSGIVTLAMQPRREDIADSCSVSGWQMQGYSSSSRCMSCHLDSWTWTACALAVT